MMSIATSACAFCVSQTANAADVSTSTSSVSASTVSSVAGSNVKTTAEKPIGMIYLLHHTMQTM